MLPVSLPLFIALVSGLGSTRDLAGSLDRVGLSHGSLPRSKAGAQTSLSSVGKPGRCQRSSLNGAWALQ
jgi:hypothetical protein